MRWSAFSLISFSIASSPVHEETTAHKSSSLKVILFERLPAGELGSLLSSGINSPLSVCREGIGVDQAYGSRGG